MTKLPQEELEQIIEQDLPGYRICAEPVKDEGFESADSTAANTNEQVEAVTPDVQSMRMKYLNDKYLGSDAETLSEYPVSDESYEANFAEDADNSPQDEIVAVKPESSAHPWDRSARPKAAVISGREKKVIGQQG